MKRFFILLANLFVLSNLVLAQSGGLSTYQFMEFPVTARHAALGSNFLSVNDDDLGLALTNPALISDEMNNDIQLSFIDAYSDIAYGSLAYGRSLPKYGNFVASLHYMNLGTLDARDQNNIDKADFGMGDYAFGLGWGRQLHPNFSIGADLQGIFSSYGDEYNAFALAVDVAGTYFNPDNNLSISLAFSNIGRQLNTLSEMQENLPFNIQLALSKRLTKGPFRFHVVLNQLNRWKSLKYQDPYDPDWQQDTFTGEVPGKSSFDEYADLALRHLIVGLEFIPTKVITVRMSFDYNKRMQMRMSDRFASSGISFGIALKLKKFKIEYSRMGYHLAGSQNFFTLSANL